MTRWHDGRLAVLDLETTSADPEQARIVTACIGYVAGGQPTDIVTLLANPEVDIPADATAIHGITNQRARRDGQPIEDVLDIVLGVIDRRPAGAPLVVFNAPYDLTVLDRESRRHGVCGVSNLLIVDPLVIDKHLHRYRPGSRKLAAMCAHYRARIDAPHKAGSDAISAGRLAWAIAKRGQVIRRVRDESDDAELVELQREWAAVRDDLEQLHHAQARWAASQAVGLAAHFQARGEPQEVRADWPVIPASARSLTGASFDA